MPLGVFVYFMCPETGGKSLEEVDLVFVDKDDAPVAMHDLEVHDDEFDGKESNRFEFKEKI